LVTPSYFSGSSVTMVILTGAFGTHALRDLHHAVAFGPLTHLLAAGHGDRIVVQDLVGDVHTRRDALAHRQQAAVEVGAVAQVGKNVLVGGERLPGPPRARPRRPFA
jgi:hypothetical protein